MNINDDGGGGDEGHRAAGCSCYFVHVNSAALRGALQPRCSPGERTRQRSESRSVCTVLRSHIRQTSTCLPSPIHPSIHPSVRLSPKAQRRALACLFRSHVATSGVQRRRLRSALRRSGGCHSPLISGGQALLLDLLLSRSPAAVPRLFTVIMEAAAAQDEETGNK